MRGGSFPAGQNYANEVRVHRAEVLRGYRLGEVGIADVLADSAISRMPIQQVLEYTPVRPWNGNGHVPHGAKQFAWQVIAEMGCSPWREVGLLTDRQVGVCISAVCGSLPERRGTATIPTAPGLPGRFATGSHTWSHHS